MFYFQQSQQTWSKSFVFCLNSKPMNSRTVLDSVKVQMRHYVTYFTRLDLTVLGPLSAMIPSPRSDNCTELVDDGTNFNNCFQMKRHSSHVKYVVTLHRNVFLWNMCTLSTNTASSQNKTLFSCEAHFILSGTCTMPWNKKLLMRFISDKPW